MRSCPSLRPLPFAAQRVAANMRLRGQSAPAQRDATATSEVLQRLRDAVDAFAASPDDKAAVLACCACLDTVQAADVGVAAPLQESGFLRSLLSRTKPVQYLRGADSPALSVGVFLLPAGSKIPLHNHPGMTVISRLLYGKLELQSYDWVASNAGSAAEGGECVRTRSSVLTGPAPAVALYANRGNVHELHALTDCAVLDVLAPPYSAREGRDCTYYQVEEREGERLWLRPVASAFTTVSAPGRMRWPA
jgi:PCO_ADO